MTSRPAFLAAFGVFLASTAWAGQSGPSPAVTSATVDPAAPENLPFSIDGPAPPVAPATIARDESGRATVRAVRLPAPLHLDGALDEAIYTSVPPISDFIQVEPQEGAPATEKTEVWVSFDNDYIYVSFRCFESDPTRVVANEMRRDGNNLWQGNDVVGFVFDTFYDRRNRISIHRQSYRRPVRRSGHQRATVERRLESGLGRRNRRFEGGWTVEAALPFKSLRYRPGRAQIWGFNAVRTNRWKNELSFVTRHSKRAWHARPQPGVTGGNDGRIGSTLGIKEPRNQAVRHLGPDDRSRRHARDFQRRHR